MKGGKQPTLAMRTGVFSSADFCVQKPQSSQWNAMTLFHNGLLLLYHWSVWESFHQLH